MANNKISVSVDAEVNGFQQGMEAASKSVEKFERTVADVDTKTNGLKKALRDAKKESDTLALAWSKLDDEAKNSKFGTELKAKLDAAMQATSELIDLNGDLAEQYKNLANDTRWFDTAVDGLELVSNVGLSVIGTIGTITGKTEDANRAMSALAAVTGVLSTAQKIQQAVQKQSNLMLAIGTLQTKAKAAADRIAAKTTGELTIAQRAFNAVAKANPYVLLGVGIATVAAGLIAYITNTKKATTETEKLEKEASQFEKDMDDVSNTYKSKLASSLADMITKYTALQNSYRKLSSTHQKQDWINKYKDNLKELGLEINNISDAERYLVNETDQVKQAFLERAKAAAAYAKLQDLLQKKFEAQYNAQQKANKNNFQEGQEVRGSDVERYGLVEGVDYQRQANQIGNGVLTAAGAIKANMQSAAKAVKSAGQEYDDEINALIDIIDDSVIKTSGSKTPKGSVPNNVQKEVEAAKGSINDLGKQISTLQEQAKKGILPEKFNSPEKLQQELARLESEKLRLEIQWGFAKPTTQREKLEQAVKDAQTSIELAVSINDSEAEAKARQAAKTAQKALDDYNLRLRGEIEFTAENKQDIDRQINDILESVNPDNTFEINYDFSGLSDEMTKEANKVTSQMELIKSGMERLQEIMDDPNSSDYAIAKAGDELERLIALFKQLGISAKAFEIVSDEAKKTQLTINTVGQAVDSLGSIFNSIGQLTEDPGAKVAGIVAQAVANYILGWTEATKQAAALGPIGWAAFGLSTAAQMLAMVAQIKSAATFEQGGVITGPFRQGDRMLIRANAGERVLTERQNKAFEELVDMNVSGSQNVHVTGVIRGRDLLLVANNEAKWQSKSGRNISF